MKPNDDRLFSDIAIPLQQCFMAFYNPAIRQNLSAHLPGCEVLNKTFNQANLHGKKLSFINQDDNLPYPHLAYEARIFEQGLIATRKNNCHDFFNAMVWHTFPRLKAMLNQLHSQSEGIGKTRGHCRDAVTLFDESGMVIISNNKERLQDIQQHRWATLFQQHAKNWHRNIVAVTVGHALYEKYLLPYNGLTANALLIYYANIQDVDAIHLIQQNSDVISQALSHPKNLTPLPVLGIPHYHDIQNNKFYGQKNYFRPLSKKIKGKIIVIH